MRKVMLIVLVFLSTVAPFITPVQAYTFQSAEVNYTLSGIYLEEQSTVTIESASVKALINPLDGEVSVLFKLLNETMGSLPYGINDNLFYLTDAEKDNLTKNAFPLVETREYDPTRLWFYLVIYKVEITMGDLVLECIYDKNINILYQMKMYKQESTFNKLVMIYVDSTLDIYHGYEESQVLFMKFATYSASINGIIFYCILGACVFGLFYFNYRARRIKISRTKQVTKSRVRRRNRGR